MVITRRPACSGTRSATYTRFIRNTSKLLRRVVCITSGLPQPLAGSSRSPGSLPPPPPRCWLCSPRTSPGTPTTPSAGGATTSTPMGCRRRRRSTRRRTERYSDPGFFNYGAEGYPPLSLDRPEPFNHIGFDEKITDPIEGRQACHLAPAEWRLLGWLERQGFAYDYYAETQFHFGPA